MQGAALGQERRKEDEEGADDTDVGASEPHVTPLQRWRARGGCFAAFIMPGA